MRLVAPGILVPRLWRWKLAGSVKHNVDSWYAAGLDFNGFKVRISRNFERALLYIKTHNDQARCQKHTDHVWHHNQKIRRSERCGLFAYASVCYVDSWYAVGLDFNGFNVRISRDFE